MAGTVLIVDDEIKITQVLEAYFRKSGFQTLSAYNGKTALSYFLNHKITLVILDLMLPDISGEEICRQIRAFSQVPIIMLTAKAEEFNLIHGLEIGADDYITKPFSPRTVVAKAEALLRRTAGGSFSEKPIVFGDGFLVVDSSGSEVRVGGVPVKLTPTEFRLLHTMAQSPGRVFSREQLIQIAFGENYDGFDRSVDTHIKTLRAKIEPDRKHPIFIVTVHGFGYKFLFDTRP